MKPIPSGSSFKTRPTTISALTATATSKKTHARHAARRRATLQATRPISAACAATMKIACQPSWPCCDTRTPNSIGERPSTQKMRR